MSIKIIVTPPITLGTTYAATISVFGGELGDGVTELVVATELLVVELETEGEDVECIVETVLLVGVS